LKKRQKKRESLTNDDDDGRNLQIKIGEERCKSGEEEDEEWKKKCEGESEEG
jgi:hypothetical protein